MAFCEKCGTQIEEGVKFCPSCGAPAAEQPQPEQPAQDVFTAKFEELNNTADTTGEFTQDDIEKNKLMAVLAYILFLVPLLAAKDSPFARFHTNQGLVNFLLGLVSTLLAIIPVIGWILSPIMALGVTVLAIIGILNAANGKAKELPLIGKFKILK